MGNSVTRNDRAAGGEFALRRSNAFFRHVVVACFYSLPVAGVSWFSAWYLRTTHYQRLAVKLAILSWRHLKMENEREAYIHQYLQPWFGQAVTVAGHTWNFGVAGFVLGFCFVWWGFGQLGRKERQHNHRRGATLEDAVTLKKRIWKEKLHPEITLAGMPIPSGMELTGTFIQGATGTGKSSLLRGLLDQARALGEKALIYDPGGQFLSVYARPGDILLNPYDDRADHYQLMDEFSTKAEAMALATALLPKPKEESQKSNFTKGARSILAEVLWFVKNSPQPTMRNLYQWLMNTPHAELLKALAGTPAARRLGDEAPEQASAMLESVADAVEGWCEQMANLEERYEDPFSLRRWVREGEPGSFCFITRDVNEKDSMQHIMSCWLSLAAREVMAMGDSHGKRRLWIIVDELVDLDRLESLGTLLAQGRKHGAVTVLSTQNVPGVREIYGRDGTASMLDNLNIKFIMRATEAETAEWVSKSIGEREIERKNTTENSGQGQGLFGQNQTIERNPLVMAGEIMSMPDRCGYLLLPGYPRALVWTPFEKPREIVQEAYVPC